MEYLNGEQNRQYGANFNCIARWKKGYISNEWSMVREQKINANLIDMGKNTVNDFKLIVVIMIICHVIRQNREFWFTFITLFDPPITNALFVNANFPISCPQYLIWFCNSIHAYPYSIVFEVTWIFGEVFQAHNWQRRPVSYLKLVPRRCFMLYHVIFSISVENNLNFHQYVNLH